MAKSRITIPVFVPHSGCRHQCVFCNQWRVSGQEKNSGPADIDRAVNTYLSSITDSIVRVEIAFFGGSFTGIAPDRQRQLLERAARYVNDGTVHSIRLSTRPDYISHESLSLLKEYGVGTVELGVQSFDHDVLAAAGRGHTAADVYRAMELLKEYGFRRGIQLMPGLPRDTMDRSLRSAAEAAGLGPDDARIYPCVVLAGTALEEMFRRGEFVPLTMEEAVERSAIMYRLLVEKCVNVIRIGLHPLESPESSVIAGPYHTAMGFLVKSRYRRMLLEEMISMELQGGGCAGTATLLLPGRCTEEYIGLKRENISYLKSKYFSSGLAYRVWDKDYPGLEC